MLSTQLRCRTRAATLAFLISTASGGRAPAQMAPGPSELMAGLVAEYPRASYAGRDEHGVPRYIRRFFTEEERRLLRDQLGIEEPQRLYLSDTTGGTLTYDSDWDGGERDLVSSYRIGAASVRQPGETWEELERRLAATGPEAFPASARRADHSLASLDPVVRREMTRMLDAARHAGFRLTVRETSRSAERQAYLLTLDARLTHTATSRHADGYAADIVVDDGDLRHALTRSHWIAFRRWLVANESGTFRLIGAPDRSWDWPHIEYAGGPGFRSIEAALEAARWCVEAGAADCTDAWRAHVSSKPSRRWRLRAGRSILSGMTLPEAEHNLSLAVEAVVTRFGAMVRQVGRRYRLDEADLDEVMQEVRIRLWRAQRTSEQIGEVSTSYVYRTASSAALDVIRRRRSRRAEHHQSIDAEDGAVALAEPAPDPHGALEGSEVVRQVAQAIEAIPASRRPVVRMYLAGHPREEIAGLMGWTEGKTRNLLYRGLADLRDRLQAMGVGWERAEEAG